MKEQETIPEVNIPLDGQTDAYGEGFPEPDIELIDGSTAQQEQQERAEANEREAMLAILTPMVEMGCNIVVGRMEGADPVSTPEAQALTERIWSIAEYYDLQVSESWALWFGLVATTGGIFGPRVVAARKHAQEKAQYEGQSEASEEGRSHQTGDRTEGARQDDQTPGVAGRGGENESEASGLYT